MALLMIIGTYPPSKLNELFKVNVDPKKPPYPPGVKKLHNWVAQVTNGLYKNYGVYQCPDDKVVESIAAMTKRYNFYAQIDEYRFSIEILGEAENALKIMTG